MTHKHKDNHKKNKSPVINVIAGLFVRANEGTQTPDLLITNQLLYRLSYISESVSSIGESGEIVKNERGTQPIS